MKNLIQISILLSLFCMSCEEQMIMIPPAPSVAEGRVLLIEDMTGVGCVPCAGANIFLEQVLQENKGSVVIYGVHGNIQSDPVTDSKYDFRYDDAFALEQDFNVIGKPSAAFNRVTFNNGRKVQLNISTWQPIIDAELSKPQVAEIKMFSSYDEETRRADIEVSVIPLEDISGEVEIHVVISESHLIDPQLTPEGPIKDYEHNHVMKKSLTGLGAFLANDLQANEPYNQNYSYTVPEAVSGEWIPENMEVTAFITAKDRDNEVQQAFQIHLIN